MSGAGKLALQIAEALRQRCTHQVMPGVALQAGLIISPEAEGLSKRDRALAALEGKSLRELGEVAKWLGAHWADFALEELGLAVLEEAEPPITEITRRDVAKCFGDDLSGERNVLDLARRLFPIDTLSADFVVGRSLARDIEQHMISNFGDWSVEYLFEKIGALSCSRDRFARLIEAALHPLGRRGPAQAALADELTAVLRRDGYMLAVDGEESGYPLYRVRLVGRGVTGAPKNLIFASNGPKPEIGFSDAINNDIVILSNASSCLIYDRPIRRDGLLWSELVDWWDALEGGTSGDSARALGLRLRASLASDAERSLFEAYFRLYKPRLRGALPALIPQVYLHYDPAVVKQLRRRAALPRQRMDFLMLLPNHQRVVIEVDGSHHFTRDGKPSLLAYADMVSADRDLRLAGYEIYRFGANELVGDGAQDVIARFFERLLTLHKLLN
jgi:very-short-patch-repair endonuclease